MVGDPIFADKSGFHLRLTEPECGRLYNRMQKMHKKLAQTNNPF